MNGRHGASQDDLAFARAFEACEVSPDAFDHAAHVRLAYIYLCEGSVDAAIDGGIALHERIGGVRVGGRVHVRESAAPGQQDHAQALLG